MRMMLIDSKNKVKTVEVCHIGMVVTNNNKEQALALNLSNGQIMHVHLDKYIHVQKILPEINKELFHSGKYCLDCERFEFCKN